MIKCPRCGKEVDEWEAKCPYCKTDFDKYDKGEKSRKDHAYWLNIFAIINIILCIITAIIIFINYSTIEVPESYDYITETYVETTTNWIGIISGIAVLFFGFTQYFLLETIVDIHDMTEDINIPK